MKIDIAAILRSSEFWTAAGLAVVESMHEPVPAEYKGAAYVYIGARVLSKVVKFVIPNPGSTSPGWLKDDSK